ncbi:MAG: hypothetical protein HY040_00180 [Planctomycetes bacterium]|nr:hypothetical protein [Planctomycetota bacterium]
MARADAQRVVLGLIRETNGIWDSKTKLFQAFYFAHLYYARDFPGILTDWPIAHMTQGPGIYNSSALFSSLTNKGYLKIERIEEGPFPEFRFVLTQQGLSGPLLPADALDAVSKAAAFVSPRTVAEVSQITHEHSRAWNEGKSGSILDIYVDLIPGDEFETKQKRLAELDEQLALALVDQQIQTENNVASVAR